MTKLVETEKAIALMEEQLINAAKIPTEHLIILATDKGRFNNDRFLIYHHELKLRMALEDNNTLDVEYARSMIRAFAQGEINVIMSKELSRVHIPAIHSRYSRSVKDQRQQMQNNSDIQRQHKETIARLLRRCN